MIRKISKLIIPIYTVVILNVCLINCKTHFFVAISLLGLLLLFVFSIIHFECLTSDEYCLWTESFKYLKETSSNVGVVFNVHRAAYLGHKLATIAHMFEYFFHLRSIVDTISNLQLFRILLFIFRR